MEELSAAVNIPDLRLNVGCGTLRLDGWLNCDRYPGDAVDMVFDLEQVWPFGSNSVKAVFASHTLEHLNDYRTFFREAWRVLHAEGQLMIRVPYGGHSSAMGDVTHLRPWYPESFTFLHPGYAEAVRNLQHGAWRHYYRIDCVDVRLAAELYRWFKIPVLRGYLARGIEYMPQLMEELHVYLAPLKTRQAIDDYRASHLANTVPMRYILRHPSGRMYAVENGKMRRL